LVNGGVANGGAKVTTANIVASNGLIHVVDGVILLTIVNHIKPKFIFIGSSYICPQASVLATLTGATAAVSITVYAPDNGAFTAATATGGYLVGKRMLK
jgi:uncharacterized surface protein with fasciclin (FAS1) repeats